MLSPYLFIIEGEMSIRRMKQAIAEHQTVGYNVGFLDERLAQLMYADECLLFCDAEKSASRKPHGVVQRRCEDSGATGYFAKMM